MHPTHLFYTTLALILTTAPLVNGHGYVQNVTIDSKLYNAWHPFDEPYASPPPSLIARKVPDDGPVTNVDDTSIRCNAGGEAGAPLSAPANGGSVITFAWNRWPSDHLGPVTTYLANCNGPCANYDGSGQNWFKIHQAGMGADGKWASENLIANNVQWTITLPSTLKPGEYLIRHEILALHSAGAPQFYPHCSQLTISGSGSAVPASNELVSFPGVYDNAGQATMGDIWSSPPKTWPIAGPQVALLAGGPGGPNDPDAATNAPSSSSPSAPDPDTDPAPVPAPTSPSTPSKTTKQPQATSTATAASEPGNGVTPAVRAGQCRLRKDVQGQAQGVLSKRHWDSRRVWKVIPFANVRY